MGMKVNGKTITGPRVHTVVFPYGEDEFIAFKFRALTSKDDFSKVQPRPKPPKIQKPGQEPINDYADPGFKKKMEQWGENKVNWEFLQSISVTEGLEWASVNMSDPNTWGNWKTDIEEYFGTVDFSMIFGGFLEANSLSDEKMEEARKRFLASQAAAQ